MDKINRILGIGIIVLGILISCVAGYKGYAIFSESARHKEIIKRNTEALAYVQSQEILIQEMSREDLEQFVNHANQMAESDPVITGSEDVQEAGVSENDVSGSDISGNDISGNDISGNDISGNDISGNDISGNDVSGNDISGNDISGNDISGNDMSENEHDIHSQITLTDSKMFWNGYVPAGITTPLDRRRIKSSYQETQELSVWSKNVLANKEIEFGDIKITCLGDSITQAANLDHLNDYQELSYPAVLGRALQADCVTNLGIGGSSFGRYWSDPFVERYMEIPEDSDIIIVMGGTNDGFCVTEAEFGDMDIRAERTYLGDMDELMRGLKEQYSDALIVFVTPLPNVLHDHLRAERKYLLAQDHYAYGMINLAKEYDIPVIDLFHSNLLDSHDIDIIEHYMPDGVHCNQAGYEILGEYIGAQLVMLLEEQKHE